MSMSVLLKQTTVNRSVSTSLDPFAVAAMMDMSCWPMDTSVKVLDMNQKIDIYSHTWFI